MGWWVGGPERWVGESVHFGTLPARQSRDMQMVQMDEQMDMPTR